MSILEVVNRDDNTPLMAINWGSIGCSALPALAYAGVVCAVRPNGYQPLPFPPPPHPTLGYSEPHTSHPELFMTRLRRSGNERTPANQGAQIRKIRPFNAYERVFFLTMHICQYMGLGIQQGTICCPTSQRAREWRITTFLEATTISSLHNMSSEYFWCSVP